nr:General substrate transporter domain containing protein [Haemonchus contortus]
MGSEAIELAHTQDTIQETASEKDRSRVSAVTTSKNVATELATEETEKEDKAEGVEVKRKSDDEHKGLSEPSDADKRKAEIDKDLKRERKSDDAKELGKTPKLQSPSTRDVELRRRKSDSEGVARGRSRAQTPKPEELYMDRIMRLDADPNMYWLGRFRGQKTPRRRRKVVKEKSKLTSSLMFATFCSSMTSFQFGYSIGCINAPKRMITEWIMVSHEKMFEEKLDQGRADLTFQTIVAIFGVGGAVGGLISGVLANAAGRRGCLLYTNIIAFLAAAFMGTAKYAGIYTMMYLGRFFIGIYVGISVVVPMYQIEIAPTKYRGFIGSFHQLLICASILFSQLMGHPMLLGTPERWPLIFGFIAIPAIVQVITLPMIPESPRFTLCIRGDVEQAREDLEILRETRNVSAEIVSMKAEAAAVWDTLLDRPSMLDMFRKELRQPTMIVIVMMIFQQLTGINVVMFYSTMIFEDVGLNGGDAIFATIMVGTVNLLTTFIQMYYIDRPKCGRKSLLKLGTIGMIITTLSLTVSITYKEMAIAKYISVASVMIFVFSFALGPAAISWILASELFLTNARANGNAYMSAANWTTSSLIGFVFPEINDRIHQYSFLLLTFFHILYLCFYTRYLPETRRRSIREIHATFET